MSDIENVTFRILDFYVQVVMKKKQKKTHNLR